MESNISNAIYSAIANMCQSIDKGNATNCNCGIRSHDVQQQIFPRLRQEEICGTGLPQSSYVTPAISHRPMKRKKKSPHHFNYVPCYVTNLTSSTNIPTMPSSSNRFVELPPADPSVLQVIQNDPTGFINVQGSLKEVRFYGENAIVIMDWDDPRDVTFEMCSRRVVIDDRDIVLLTFNRPYINYTFPDGTDSRLRLGAPTRDLYIDGMFVQATFGGLPVQVSIGGFCHKIQLGGPNPKICVGSVKRNDLLLGRVNLIVDENLNNIFHIYLDLKPQRFNINGIPLVLRISETLQTVFINDVPVSIDFGGHPVLVNVFGEIHQLRLSPLPKGAVPGLINISGMKSASYQPLLMTPTQTKETAHLSQNTIADNNNYNGNSVSDGAHLHQACHSSSTNLNVDIHAQLSTISDRSNINVKLLYQELVDKGIIQQVLSKERRRCKKEFAVDLSNPETLKAKNMRFVFELYTGAQCNICSLRFLRRDGEYASHVDWHFQSKRHKPSQPTTQKWWCRTSEFLRSEQDYEQLTWFERKEPTEKSDEYEKLTVPAKGYGENPSCSVCLEKFTQYFNEDEDEWHLKCATVHNGKLCHPLCSQDLKGNSVIRNLTPEVEQENPSAEQIVTLSDDSDQDCKLLDDAPESILETLKPKLNVGDFGPVVIKDENDSTCNSSKNSGVNNIPLACNADEVTANNGEKDEYNDTDILEIVDVKPNMEIIDLTEHLEDCEMVKTEDNSSFETKMHEDEDGKVEPAIDPNTALDGETEYRSPVIVKVNPIKVNILSYKTSLKEVKEKNKEEEDEVEEDTYYEQNLTPAVIKQKIAKAKMVVQPERFSGRDSSALCSVM